MINREMKSLILRFKIKVFRVVKIGKNVSAAVCIEFIYGTLNHGVFVCSVLFLKLLVMFNVL